MTTREEAIAEMATIERNVRPLERATEVYDTVIAPLLAEAAADALNSAAADWPDQGIVSLWLRKRAEPLRGGA